MRLTISFEGLSFILSESNNNIVRAGGEVFRFVHPRRESQTLNCGLTRALIGLQLVYNAVEC
jgi:hypothetical protein